MKFPLRVSEGFTEIPDEAKCLVCSGKIGETYGFVRLCSGAILYKDKKRTVGGPSDKMESVFSLWYHGPHPSEEDDDGTRVITSLDNAEFTLPIVSPCPGGQVDIHFCSTKCLAQFFEDIVKSLEKGVVDADQAFEKRLVEPVAGGDATR